LRITWIRRTHPYARPTRVVVRVKLVRVVGQYVQPAHFAVHVTPLSVPDGVPYARQPVGDQRERGHQQEQHRGAVFRIPVDLPRHPDQPQQPGGLQQTDERRGLQSLSIATGGDVGRYYGLIITVIATHNIVSADIIQLTAYAECYRRRKKVLRLLRCSKYSD